MLTSSQEIASGAWLCRCHTTEPLTRVCLDPLCLGRSLICFECCSSSHSGHPTIPLSQFFAEVDNSRYDQSTADLVRARLDTLKSIGSEWLTEIQRVSTDVGEALAKLAQQV